MGATANGCAEGAATPKIVVPLDQPIENTAAPTAPDPTSEFINDPRDLQKSGFSSDRSLSESERRCRVLLRQSVQMASNQSLSPDTRLQHARNAMELMSRCGDRASAAPKAPSSDRR